MKKTGYVLFTRGIKEYKVRLSKFLRSSREGLYKIVELSKEEIEYQIDKSVDMMQIINCDFSVVDCKKLSINLKAGTPFYVNEPSSKSMFFDKVNFGNRLVQIQCDNGTIECDTVEAGILFLEGNNVKVSNIQQVSMSIHAQCVNIKDYTLGGESYNNLFVLTHDARLENINVQTIGEIQISYKNLLYRNLLLRSPNLYMQYVLNSNKMDRIGIWTIDDEVIAEICPLPRTFGYLQQLYPAMGDNKSDMGKQYIKKNTK